MTDLAEMARTTTCTTDPVTSLGAAVSAARRTPYVRERVLAILNEYGPCTHDRLIRLHQRKVVELDWPPATDSSLRTRCHELVRDGLVESVAGQIGVSDARHSARLWRAVGV